MMRAMASKMNKSTNDKQPVEEQVRTCEMCGTKLSSYNPGPNCWQHTIGHPWRGPSAKPRYD